MYLFQTNQGKKGVIAMAEKSKKDKVDKRGVDIKALQRQIKVLEGKIGNQQKALNKNVERKFLGEKIKALMDEYKIKSESLEKVISSKPKSKEKHFATIVTTIGLILTFTICGFVYFSGDVVTKWAENNLTKFAENKVQRVIDDFTIDLGERSNKLEKEINKVLAGIERAEKSLDNLVTRLRKDESSKGLVVSVSENVKGTDESKHATVIPEETIGKLEQIKENLAQVKTQQGEFSNSNNPLYLQSELKIGEYTVIKSLDNIDSDR